MRPLASLTSLHPTDLRSVELSLEPQPFLRQVSIELYGANVARRHVSERRALGVGRWGLDVQGDRAKVPK